MNNQLLLFTIIHLLAYVASLVNVGNKNDGWDNRKKKITMNGIVALSILSVSFIGLIFFFFTNYAAITTEEGKFFLKNNYLGYFINFVLFFIPYMTSCNDLTIKNKIKINLIGWLTIILSTLGFSVSVIALVSGNTNLTGAYISILGKFIAGTSALVALSSQTVLTDENGKNTLTDWGRVAMSVIVIGFAVSVLNIQNAEQKSKELQRTTKNTLKNLTKVDAKIKTSLTNIDSISEQTFKLETAINSTTNNLTEISKLLTGVAKGSDLEKTMEKVNNIIKKIDEEINNPLKYLKDKTKSIETIVETNPQNFKEIKTDISAVNSSNTQLNKNVTNLKTTVNDLNKDALKMGAKLDEIEKNSAKKSDVSNIKRDISILKTQIMTNKRMLAGIEKNSVSKADINSLNSRIAALKPTMKTTNNDSLSAQIAILKSKLDLILRKLETQ